MFQHNHNQIKKHKWEKNIVISTIATATITVTISAVRSRVFPFDTLLNQKRYLPKIFSHLSNSSFLVIFGFSPALVKNLIVYAYTFYFNLVHRY